MQKSKYSGVILDLDGTLLDSLPGIARAMNLVLASCGRPWHPEEAYRDYIGNGLEETVRRAARAAGLQEDSGNLVSEYRRHYREVWPDFSLPYPGIHAVLRKLAARSAVQLAVLSNKHEQFTRDMTAYFFPDIPFKAVRGSMDGIPAKPDPLVALEIAALQGLAPERIFLLGDSEIDLQTARNAGMQPVLAAWGYGSPGLSSAFPEALVLTEAGDLLELFH